MKTTIICFVFSFLVATALVVTSDGAQPTSKIISLGPGHNLQWSPSGAILSFVSKGQLYTFHTDRAQLRQVGPFEGNEYAWITDSELVDMTSQWNEPDRTHWSTLTYYTLPDTGVLVLDSNTVRKFESRTPPKLYASDRAVFLWGVNKLKGADIVANRPHAAASQIQAGGECPYIRAESHTLFSTMHKHPYYDDTDVWLIDRSGVASKRITLNEPLSFPSLSPSCDHVFGTDMGGYTRVYDTSGALVTKFRGGDRKTWTADGTGIVYARLEYSGRDQATLSGGDLYLFRMSDSTELRLTFSPSIPENRPSVSPSGAWIAYVVQTDQESSVIQVMRFDGGKHE